MPVLILIAVEGLLVAIPDTIIRWHVCEIGIIICGGGWVLEIQRKSFI
jgi:hypothetical protein